MKTFLDWSAYDTYGMGDAYAGIPATGGNYAKAVAVCMNNHQCQRDGKGVMCPSYRIPSDPAHSTGARVRAFKAALNGEFGERPFIHPDLAAAMDVCVSFKGCKKGCPSWVDCCACGRVAGAGAGLNATVAYSTTDGLPAARQRSGIALCCPRNCIPPPDEIVYFIGPRPSVSDVQVTDESMAAC